MKNITIVGVTGYLGSGKSTALKFFKDAGFCVIDSDDIVHNLYKQGEAGWRKIKKFFGEEYLKGKSGDVDRKILGKFVFENPAKLKILEKLIHPLVFNEIRHEIKSSKKNKIAIEAVAFDEKQIGHKIDYKVWIDLDFETAYRRCGKTRTLSFDNYMKLLKSHKKSDKINFNIKNDGTKEEFKKKILKVADIIISQTGSVQLK